MVVVVTGPGVVVDVGPGVVVGDGVVVDAGIGGVGGGVVVFKLSASTKNPPLSTENINCLLLSDTCIIFAYICFISPILSK